MRQVEIVICDRGWVVVGEVDSEDPGELVVRFGAVVRRWGTTGEGIGALAAKGPLEMTTLDVFDEWRVERSAVVGRLACRPGPWEKWLDDRRADCREGGYAA